MKKFMFANSMSYFAYLCMSGGLLVASQLKFSAAALFLWLSIVVLGGVIEGIIEGASK